MIKILIVDDDINVHRILTMIINHEGVATVMDNVITDGNDVIEAIEEEKPDIVIIDLLMPKKDGISAVKEIKKTYDNIQFVMLSQVTSKDMVAKAYEAGIEFYINKPINAIEVKTVLKKVIEKIQMEIKLNQIKTLIGTEKHTSSPKINEDAYMDKIKYIMKRIGILGEAGCEDIIKTIEYMIANKDALATYTLKEIFEKISSKPKSVEQRIRRTAFMALNNLANIGIEDYMNDTFSEFSTSLFSFDEVKREMDYIRGKEKERGKINVKKFLEGIYYYIE